MRRVVAAGRMQHLVSIAAPKLAVKTNRAHLDESVKHYRKARAGLDELAEAFRRALAAKCETSLEPLR
jgi:hypothetical protein